MPRRSKALPPDIARNNAEALVGGPLVLNVSMGKLGEESRTRRMAQMVVLYHDHRWSLDQVASAYGLTKERVRQLFDQYGLPRRDPDGATKYRRSIDARRKRMQELEAMGIDR